VGEAFRCDCGEVDVALRLERVRIARELHDVVGNRLVVIGMHARRLSASEPQAAEHISALARLAMQDVRQVVGQLHDTGHGDLPRLLSEDVDALVGYLPDGLVTLEFAGRETVLPVAVHRAMLRIVQECLTNAIKHGAGKVVVRLAFGAELALEVVNTLPETRVPERRGFGLEGIRARAVEQGGSAWWRESANTFRVFAVVPLSGVLTCA
jgi:signal transduction histidine kinase